MRKKPKAVKATEVRHWQMMDKPRARLTYHRKKRGEYWRRVTLEMPLYEGLIQEIERLTAHSLHRGWPGEWLYYNLLKLVQFEHALQQDHPRQTTPPQRGER